jgi:hypothetical protein
MKTSIFTKFLLIALLFISSACSTSTTTPPPSTGLGLAAAPWSNGETTNYQWLDDASGSQIGTSTITISLQTANWYIKEMDTIGQLEQTIEMTISVGTLEPVSEQKSIKSPGNDIQLTSTYSEGKADISAVVNGTTKTASVDVPENAIDNDQLLMTLRALPFSEGYKVSYVIVNTMNATKIDGTFTVQPHEMVTVPAGTFDAWKVDMVFGQTTQYAWYGVDSPHQLVKYDNGSTQMVLSK